VALGIAFALTVMGDPVSAVTYAVEAALRALGGDAARLLAAVALVVAATGLLVASYHRLVAAFPRGGGAAAATAAGFGPGWALVPLGALLVDDTLTVALSAAEAATALGASWSALAPWRLVLALAATGLVAGLSCLGDRGRGFFAGLTALFVGVSGLVPARGLAGPATPAPPPAHPAGLGALLRAYSVSLAMATGVEAPASALGGLGPLPPAALRALGQATLWGTLAVVGSLTLAMAALVRHTGVPLPALGGTLVAAAVRRAVGPGPLFAAFQATSSLLLLAAASSGFAAGSGLLAALARDGGALLPTWLGRANRHHAPVAALLVVLAAASLVLLAADARPEVLVTFYAVAVFLAVLPAELALAREAARRRAWGAAALHGVTAAVAAATLAVDAARGRPLASLAAAGTVAAVLYARWRRRGRPGDPGRAEAAAAA